jgi:hypothetical protein
MRFYERGRELKGREGEIRIVRKFLFFSERFGENKTRWLEFADIVEQVNYNEGCWDYSESWYWHRIGFADEFFVSKDGMCGIFNKKEVING